MLPTCGKFPWGSSHNGRHYGGSPYLESRCARSGRKQLLPFFISLNMRLTLSRVAPMMSAISVLLIFRPIRVSGPSRTPYELLRRMSREQKQINRDKHIKLMGVYKWQLLGKAYPLDGTRTPTERELERAAAFLTGDASQTRCSNRWTGIEW